jgi:hypothetical protein
MLKNRVENGGVAVVALPRGVVRFVTFVNIPTIMLGLRG